MAVESIETIFKIGSIAGLFILFLLLIVAGVFWWMYRFRER